MASLHIAAERGDIADTVLMPGDPKRAKMIAERYLEGARLVNDIRGVNGYTGSFNGRRYTVMASGMGIPSMGIYSYELFNFFDVEKVIRVGTAGAISSKLKLRDMVIALGVCTDSNYGAHFGLRGSYAPVADFELASTAYKVSSGKGYTTHIGNVFSSDVFYDDLNSLRKWDEMGVLAVEMESAALYMNAARAGKRALCICTISDCPLHGGAKSTPEERESSFTSMVELALEL